MIYYGQTALRKIFEPNEPNISFSKMSFGGTKNFGDNLYRVGSGFRRIRTADLHDVNVAL